MSLFYFRSCWFSSVSTIADPVQPAVRGAEIRVGTQRHIMKKTGISVGTDTPVSDQILDETAVHTASGVVHDLLDLQSVFSNGLHFQFLL